jgi:hypothetical protein
LKDTRLATPKRSVALLIPRKVDRSIPPGCAARVHRRRSKLEPTNCPSKKTETADPIVNVKTIVLGFEKASIGCGADVRNATTIVPVEQTTARIKSMK